MTQSATMPSICRLGRPSSFTAEFAEDICERLMEGESLRTICGRAGMPARGTVLRWVDQDATFRAAYVEARRIQQHILGSRTELLRGRLPSEDAPWPVFMAARDKLQAHLRRVGQLRAKRHHVGLA